jgi:RNA polymerase sigma-B factor
MLIHVVSRPLSEVSHMPASGLRTVTDHLRRAGAEVVADVGIAHGDFRRAVGELRAHLHEQWEQSSPDVVHAIGVVAAAAALAARPEGTRVLCTFDERPAPTELEKALAVKADAVLPLSSSELAHWRAVGAPTHAPGALMVPPPAAQAASTGGDVVCLSTGPGLQTVVESMPYWGPARLVLLGRLSADTRARLRATAQQLGVHDRIAYRPGPRGPQRAHVWARAALLIAGSDGARHGGHVLEAAAHGVPSVALAREAHLDHIVPGATGVLVEPTDGARGLGRAVAQLLRDPLRCRGMGSAALVRNESLHDHAGLGERLLGVYREIAGHVEQQVSRSTTAPLTAQATSLTMQYMPLARQLAQRYAGRGQRLEDLIQVASLGLVRAASRFDPDYGTEFHSFAVPTILGELRRHFRDHAWAARVPRSLQEVTLKVQKAADELRVTKGVDPTPADIADNLGLLEQEVRQAMQARGEAMSSKSLDHPMGEDGDEAYGDLVGDVDGDLEYVEMREAVREVLHKLPEREREILLMRFYGEHTQSEIAERLGLSQVHVSRLITRTLAALRDNVVNDVPLPRSWSEELVTTTAAARRAA